MPLNILITGASVAGNTAAYWLAKYGHQVTVVERAAEFRAGGQNIDVRGAGREVLRRMGIEKDALSGGTGEKGTAWIDQNGREVARLTTQDTGANGITAELEILRGSLAKLLLDSAVRQGANYVFGDHIQRLDQDRSAVNVTFSSGLQASYDYVVVAEGVGSSTRDHIMPKDGHTRPLDVLIGYFDIPRRDDDTDLWLWFHTTKGRSASLRPGTDGRTMALLSIQKPSAGEEKWDEARQKAFLKNNFEGVGWQVPRILAGLDKGSWFYFDSLRQMKLPRWSNHRVVLTGDAAWCATPIAGIGATLALVGAYVLAGEISQSEISGTALQRYEAFMRPIVEKKQNIPKLLPRLANPHSDLGLNVFHTALRFFTSPLVRSKTGNLFLGSDLKLQLPNYGPSFSSDSS